MTTVANVRNFNNLLYNTERIAEANRAEHRAGRVPLDLSYKGESPVYNIINAGAQQVNGKRFDTIYKPKIITSRPGYGGYDARFDPTILDAVRYKYIDVSGELVLPIDLPKKTVVSSYIPFQPIGRVI